MLENFNKFILSSIISSILFFILGLVLLIFPEISIKTLSYAVSVGLLIFGLILILKSEKQFAIFDFTSLGVLCVVIGVVLIIYPKTLSILIPIIIGVWMILKSILELRISLVLKKFTEKAWILTLTTSLLTSFCGIVMVVNPEMSSNFITILLGLVLIFYSLLDIVSVFVFKKYIDDVVKYFQ